MGNLKIQILKIAPFGLQCAQSPKFVLKYIPKDGWGAARLFYLNLNRFMIDFKTDKWTRSVKNNNFQIRFLSSPKAKEY